MCLLQPAGFEQAMKVESSLHRTVWSTSKTLAV